MSVLKDKILLVATDLFHTKGINSTCGKIMRDFKSSKNRRSHTWYRWFNEIPVLALIAVVILVVVKPF